LVLKKKFLLYAICGAEVLLYCDKSFKEERLIIVDQCLEFNYKVYIVPVITGKSKGNFQKVKFQIEDLLERKAIVLDNKSISRQLKDKTILLLSCLLVK
jgi:FlaA1/EpsC-like NDP-sugar epimerase